MRIRKVGEYQYKGDVGLYVEAVDRPAGQPRYAALDWAMLPEESFGPLDRKEIIESPVFIDQWYPRIEHCHGR